MKSLCSLNLTEFQRQVSFKPSGTAGSLILSSTFALGGSFGLFFLIEAIPKFDDRRFVFSLVGEYCKTRLAILP